LKPFVARTCLYTLLAAAFVAALRFTPQLPDADHKPAELLVTQAAVPSWRMAFDTLGRGESLHALLVRDGLTEAEAKHALQAATTLDERRIPAGMPITIKSPPTDSNPAEITLQLSEYKVLHLRRTDSTWTGEEENVPWVTDTIVVAGTIKSNLYDAMDASAGDDLPQGARNQLTWSLANLYEYRTDMSRDLQVGDTFSVMAERSTSPSGAVHIGDVIAASLDLSGTITKAVRFALSPDDTEYYDQSGKSLRTAFLRAPLEFRRISSVFGKREHPILGVWRMHKGTDYAAAAGTPVRAVGDGVVTRAGWGTGFGNVIEIRHPNGYVTRYGHLRGFAHGLHVGKHVKQADVIGYVGMTGLATGPHLHFEVLVNGQQRDSRIALKSVSGVPLPPKDKAAFDRLSNELIAQLQAPVGVTKLAQR
jgi:murein DD-endopeptidase MepM/ murein hydrolase activator NlpD